MESLTQKTLDDYSYSLREHVMNVTIACNALGVSQEQSFMHDDSKWSDEEFSHYARKFKGPADDPVGFDYAWLHHIHNNPHHWQYWMFPDVLYTSKGNTEHGVLEMPFEYCVEMIADWLGSSKTYTQSWDMTDWLWKNFNKVILHSRSYVRAIDLLSDMGYYRILIELGHNPKTPANNSLHSDGGDSAGQIGVFNPEADPGLWGLSQLARRR